MYKKKEFDLFWEENPCQNMSFTGTVFLERKERTHRMKRKKNEYKMENKRPSFFVSHMSPRKGFWQPRLTFFHEPFAICFHLQPVTSETS